MVALDSHGLVQYEPVALGRTVVPERLRHLMRQRSGYLLGYQALTSTASLRGYAQQIVGAARRWR